MSYGHSLQTVCLPLLDTGAILASSSDAHHPSVRSPCWSLQAKVTGSHSSSSLAFCPRVQVVWKRVHVLVCMCGVCAWVVCLSCHKLHSVRGEALQWLHWWQTEQHTHAGCIWNIEFKKDTLYRGVINVAVSPHTFNGGVGGEHRNCSLLRGGHWSFRINCGWTYFKSIWLI